MIPPVIANRLALHNATNIIEKSRALQEVTQEVILASLAKTSFFKNAVFVGGTALRIAYGMNRYSDDLDFRLTNVDDSFQWKPVLQKVKETMVPFGYFLKIDDKSRDENNTKKVVVSDQSLSQQYGLQAPIRIKLELNNVVLAGGKTILKQSDYPFSYSIHTHDLPSLFAGKCHALLCRSKVKGRDWYDFTWLNQKSIEPNYTFLSAALNQQGPWEGKQIKANRLWLEGALREKIASLDMDIVKSDVIGFVSRKTRESVNTWSKDTFLSAVDTFHKNCIKRDREKARDDRGR